MELLKIYESTKKQREDFEIQKEIIELDELLNEEISIILADILNGKKKTFFRSLETAKFLKIKNYKPELYLSVNYTGYSCKITKKLIKEVESFYN